MQHILGKSYPAAWFMSQSIRWTDQGLMLYTLPSSPPALGSQTLGDPDPGLPLLEIYTKDKIRVTYKGDGVLRLCTASLLIETKKRTWPKCPKGKWINKWGHIHTMKYHKPHTFPAKNTCCVGNNKTEQNKTTKGFPAQQLGRQTSWVSMKVPCHSTFEKSWFDYSNYITTV